MKPNTIPIALVMYTVIESVSKFLEIDWIFRAIARSPLKDKIYLAEADGNSCTYDIDQVHLRVDHVLPRIIFEFVVLPLILCENCTAHPTIQITAWAHIHAPIMRESIGAIAGNQRLKVAILE
jgi:hypothetical protein